MKRLLALLLSLLCLTACAAPREPIAAVDPPEEFPPLVVEEAGTTEEEDGPPPVPVKEKPTDVPPEERIQLSLGGIAFLRDESLHFAQMVKGFNRINSKYYVNLVDYDQEASSTDDAVTLLRTQLLSGDGPDMLLFTYNHDASYNYNYDNGLLKLQTYFSPLTLINKGMLLDMTPLLEADPDIRREDLIGLPALEEYGGLYLLSPRVSIGAAAVSPEVFGDKRSWTFEEFLEAQASLKEGQHMFVRMDPNAFLEYAGSRYVRSVVDLENAVCDFDNPAFISLLETAAQIEHYHYGGDTEFPDASVWGDWKPDAAQVADGDVLCAYTYIYPQILWMFRMHTNDAPLSYMGLPTSDGSNGMDLKLAIPIGICADTEQAEGCWEFIKYLLRHPIYSAVAWEELPLYTPTHPDYLDTFEAAKARYQMTQADIDLCVELANSCEHMAFYDEDILRIILDEARWLFSGDATAQDVASKVQARASLYMAEQYG